MKQRGAINLLVEFGIKTDSSRVTSHSSPLTIVELWGSGEPYREFLYVEDLADACVLLMENYDYNDIGEFINIGTGEDIEVWDLSNVRLGLCING